MSVPGKAARAPNASAQNLNGGKSHLQAPAGGGTWTLRSPRGAYREDQEELVPIDEAGCLRGAPLFAVNREEQLEQI